MDDVKLMTAFLDELEKLGVSHSEIMKKFQQGPTDTGESNKPSPVAGTAKKFDPKVIKQQLLMKRHGEVSKAKNI